MESEPTVGVVIGRGTSAVSVNERGKDSEWLITKEVVKYLKIETSCAKTEVPRPLRHIPHLRQTQQFVFTFLFFIARQQGGPEISLFRYAHPTHR